MSEQPPPSTESLRDRVRSAGLRCTTARLAVLECLVENRGPKTHAEVAAALQHRNFDQATIYRNLIELTEAGFLARVELGDHVWRFEWRAHDAAGRHVESHPHFVCTGCGEVSCLDDVTVAITPKAGQEVVSAAADATPADADPRQRKSVREIPRVTEILLKGRCHHCGNDTPDDPAVPPQA